MKKMIGRLVLFTMVLAVVATPAMAGDLLYSCNFEKFEGFDATGAHGTWPGDGGASVDGQNGWTFVGSTWAKVQTPEENRWAGRTGNQFLSINTVNDAAYTPEFDTVGYEKVNVSFDIRPSNQANNGYWGGYIDLLGNDLFGGQNPMILRVMLLGQQMNASKGIFTTYNGLEADEVGNAFHDPNYVWEYTSDNSTYHIEIDLDQVSRTYSLKVNGVQSQEGYVKSWLGTDFGGSVGQLCKIKFNGGNLIDKRALYDNIKIVGSNPVYSCAFEQSEGFTDGADSTPINGQNGWTVSTWGGQSIVTTITDWNDRNGIQQILATPNGSTTKSPSFDTTMYDTVNIKFDVRPCDNLATGDAGRFDLLDANGGLFARFKLECQVDNGDSFKIKAYRAWSGWSADGSMYDTGIAWSYDGPYTILHFDITLDQIARTWTLNVNGEQPLTATAQPWLHPDMGGSVLPLGKIQVVAGKQVGVYTAIDSIKVTGKTACDNLIDAGLALDGDLNGDCKVNIDDFSSMANNWLKNLLD